MAHLSTAIVADLRNAAKAARASETVTLFETAVAVVAAADASRNDGLSQNDFEGEAAGIFDAEGITWAAGATSVGNLIRFGRRVIEDGALSAMAEGHLDALGTTAVMAAVACPAFNLSEVESLLTAMADAKADGTFKASKVATYVKAAKAAKATEQKEADADGRPTKGLTKRAAKAAVAAAKATPKADPKADPKAAETADAKAKAGRVAAARLDKVLTILGIEHAADVDADAWRVIERKVAAVAKAAKAKAATKAKAKAA